MKKAILLMMITCPTLLFAQEKYVINGKAGSLNPPAKVFLIYNAGTQAITDSATIKDGTFTFTGQVSDITQATLALDYKGAGFKSLGNTTDALALFLEKGTINVTTADSLSKAKISGTKANEDYMLYKINAKPLSDALKALGIEYNSAPAEKKNSQEFVNQILQKQSAIQQQAKSMNSQFITDHPDGYISLQTLIDGINTESYPDAAALQIQFSKLSKGLRESKAGLAYQQRLDQLKTVAVGAMAPDFTQPDTAGTAIKLSSFRGKYVLVDFWASWCGPCRNENPNVVKAYQNFKNKNFTILGVSLDQPGKKDDWLKAIHTDGLTWNHVSDLKFWSNDAAVLYSVRAIPQNILIDPSGKIVARNIFGEDLQKKLTEIFNRL